MFPLGHIGITIGIIVLITYYNTDWRPKFDIRLLALGAMLPDIIDKTIGLLIFREYIDNGRIYAHTILFSVVLTLVAYYFRNRLTISLSFGSWMHVAFDKMWEVPGTLVWPTMGWGFPKIGFYPMRWIEILLTDPYVYITEVFGAGLLFILFIHFGLYRFKNWRAFWRTGNFENN